MKKNILVFPCGSEVGLEIYRSLNYSTHFNVIGGSSTQDHGVYVYKNYISDLPYVDDDLFIEKINSVITEYKINFIFPAHDSVVLKLSKAEFENKLACKVIGSPYKTCELARSKEDTYKFFKDILTVPAIFDKHALEPSTFPVFLKPDIGQGSKGTFKAEDIEEVLFYTKKDPSLLILEYLPGDEFTIDCFTDKDGSLLFCEGRSRSRISNGISVNSSPAIDPRFEELAKKINQEICFRGVWFFQVKQNKHNDLVLLEIAPRIAGTMGLVRGKGVNLALMSLFDALEQDVCILENTYDLTIDRALKNRYKHNIQYEHVYVDLDDTLIINSKINIELIAFLYQCLNKKIGLHLITRHEDILDDTLLKYRLSQIFNDVRVINKTAKKSEYILFKNSIFIDDSFSERKEVHDQIGIPVFDTHAIEILIEDMG